MFSEHEPIALRGAISLAVIIIVIIAAIICTGRVFHYLSEHGPHSLSNQQIVEQSKYCTDNGLKAEHFVSGVTGETTRIECGDKL